MHYDIMEVHVHSLVTSVSAVDKVNGSMNDYSMSGSIKSVIVVEGNHTHLKVF